MTTNRATQQKRSQRTEYGFDLTQFIDEVISRLRVEDVYTNTSHQFKESSDKHRGGCPFHDSKSKTSFVVSQNSLLFFCAGCQRGGSAIDYLYSLKTGRWDKPRGRDFIETLRQLAELAGMSLPERELSPEQIEATRKWEVRRDILRVVTEYGQEVLWSPRGEVARQYLIKERGLTEDAIRDLGLGLYLSRSEVHQILADKGYNLEDAKDAGVLWAKLEGYILFPWLDSRGRPLTIYGRYHTKTPPQEKPKTIALPGQGTKASPLYFDRALKAGHKDLVLVEGVIDAALLQSVGDIRVCGYVAASCSDGQIETMRRHGIKTVTLCGDPDEGGNSGTNNNLDRITAAGIKVYVAPSLPDGLDPDEFLIREGVEGWRRHIDAAVHAYSWKAKYLIKKSGGGKELSDKTKAAILQQAIAFSKRVKGIENNIDLKAFFWPTLCAELGVSADDFQSIINPTTNVSEPGSGNDSTSNEKGDSNGEYYEEEEDGWNPPVSWKGQIGWLVPVKQTKVERDPISGEMTPVLDEKGKPVKEHKLKFFAKCNFDFVVEREISSETGGGLVLQFKRVFDGVERQKRLIIKSTDYTEKSRFVDALKIAAGEGIVCNLKTDQLGDLFHSRIKEYRESGGKVYRLADRIGQQEDGTWVFEGIQYTREGDPTTEEESGWVFNPNLGGEDKMPSPRIAPPSHSALKNLVAAMLQFHGSVGIFPALIALGYVAAGVHYQEIMDREKHFPLINFFGDAGANKSIAAQNALSLVGWATSGFLHRVTVSAVYEWVKLSGSLPSCLDDPERSRDLDELLKGLYDGRARKVRGNYQEPHSPLMVTSNHACGDDQPATLSRLIQVPFYRQSDGDGSAWDQMQEAQRLASGALPDLIKLGYPAKEIRELASELRRYLPYAHARVADSFALVTWYAMAVARLAGFPVESVKSYVIKNLCKTANDADSVADSLTDFISKLHSLQSESQAGTWNVRLVDTDSGGAVAVNMSSVWPVLDKLFKPTYSRKVVESLIDKAGGKIHSVQKFHRSKDESLTYRRLLLNPPRNSSGTPLPIEEPENVARRCVLIPSHLVQDFVANWRNPDPPDQGGDDGDGGGGNPTPTSPNPTSPEVGTPNYIGLHQNCNQQDVGTESVSAVSLTPVTSSYIGLHQKCNQQDVGTESVSAVSDIPVTCFEEELSKSKIKSFESSTENFPHSEQLTSAISEKQKLHVTDVTAVDLEPETRTDTGLQRLHSGCNSAVTSVTGCNQPGGTAGDTVMKVAIAPPRDPCSNRHGVTYRRYCGENQLAAIIELPNQGAIAPDQQHDLVAAVEIEADHVGESQPMAPLPGDVEAVDQNVDARTTSEAWEAREARMAEKVWGSGAISPNPVMPEPVKGSEPDAVNTESAITPTQLQQPAVLSSAAASVSSKPTDLKVGDAVALADLYSVAYNYHGIVEDIQQGKVSVRWAERQGKSNEVDSYTSSELRRI